MSDLTGRAVATARRVVATVGRTRVTRVDGDGIDLVVHGEDRVVDVLFDGRRIWSFWLWRDTERPHRSLNRRTVAWPERMKPYLKGETESGLPRPRARRRHRPLRAALR
ncbi:hypothetical protein G5V59_09010 [Nocardioides sp. W3-2-3]|uniref:hypothetical protein n=1 Tax=Nocardioides convexus TaxID=2712224 RepID=UPI0024182F21|nr:hypothetical protein [Nocardioides convexus]NHA00225.1 hypothetical protein [Nocardioides convexus]